MKHIRRVIISIITGAITGVFGLLFISSFKLFNRYVVSNPYNYIFPLLGGIVLSVIWYMIGDGNKHFGSSIVSDELNSIEMQIISIKDAVLKFIGTTVSICTGFLMGKVGFFIHLGGAVGSNIAYKISDDNAERKLIITSGVAGAIAAITGSVPFAVLFVMEIYYIKGASFNKVVYPLIASAISAYVIVYFTFGKISILNVQIQHMPIGKSIMYAIIVGLLCAIIGIIMKKYIPMLKTIHNNKMPFFSPIIGGLIIGIIGYFYPEYFKMFVLDFSQDINYILMLTLLLVGLSLSMLFGAIGGEFTLLALIGALTGSIIHPSGLVAILGVSAILSSFYGAGFSVLVLCGSFGMDELIIPVAITTTIGIIAHEKLNEKIVNRECK